MIDDADQERPRRVNYNQDLHGRQKSDAGDASLETSLTFVVPFLFFVRMQKSLFGVII